MKIRNGFVTNSSSSSFIIGKVGETKVTIDEVFDIIKDSYRKWIAKSQEYFDYVNERHKQNKNYPHIENYSLVFNKDDSFDKKCAIRHELDRTIGISHYDLYDGRSIDLLECDTYKDYEEMALKKIKDAKEKKERTYGLVPFTIDYLTNPNPIMLQDGVYEKDEDESNWSYLEILDWYCPKASILDDIPEDEDVCANCEDREWCGGEDARNAISSNRELEMTARLGQVCVYSECGRIPDFVVEELANISHLWCNHMG